MNEMLLIVLLCGVIVLLGAAVIYQNYSFKRGLESQISEMAEGMEAILNSTGGEKIMVFTDCRPLKELISKMNAMLEERQRIKAEVRRMEIASKKMISNISHDIKTPMTVILGYLEVMQLNKEGNQETLKKVEQKAQYVMELMNQFFTLAKIEAGDMDLTLTRLNAGEIVREHVLDFYELLTSKGFQVDIKIKETPVYIWGNEEAIRRILFNLISNVIRYGSDGNYLGVFLREDSGFVYVDVEDKGKGIEPVFADTVFDRLFTMEDSRNREIQGSGIGLTIAKNLAVQLGGDITLKSEPYKKTTFTVCFRKYFKI